MICGACGEEREYHALGLCRFCYKSRYSARYHQRHRDRILKRQRRYRCENSEVVSEIRKRWYRENREKAAFIRHRWYQNNPEKVAAQKERRRARKNSLPATLVGENAEILLRTFPCFYCGNLEDLQLDHFVPLSKGGGTTRANIIVACGKCNRRKHDKLPNEVLEQLSLWNLLEFVPI